MADDDYGDEDYDYDFEEGSSPTKPAKDESKTADDDDDDEQHSQKVNGQLEAIQEELNSLRQELEDEREAHLNTKRKLEETLVFGGENKGGDDGELEKAHAKIKELEKIVKTSNSSKLMEDFMDFGMIHSFSNPAIDSSDMTEDICRSLLQQATKKIQSSSKPLTKKPSMGSSANASDSDLRQRISNLEEELRNALGAAEDIRALKAKAVSLVERIRLEKEDKLRVEAEQKQYVKKIEMLSDHVEKLMIHLKHEAAAKIKAVDQLRNSEKRNRVIQDNLDVVSRKASAKDRLIAELREGSKILEDQLRLMDEKYLELRTKLDYAREVASKKVRSAQKTASELRVKFALAGNQKLLDHMPLPDIGASGDYGMTGGSDFSRSMPAMGTLNTTQGTSSAGGSRGRSHGSARKKPKKKANNKSIAQDAEQSTERVLDKLRRLKGGEAQWTEEKARKLIS
jgi:hypothetical protein